MLIFTAVASIQQQNIYNFGYNMALFSSLYLLYIKLKKKQPLTVLKLQSQDLNRVSCDTFIKLGHL